MDNHVVVVLEDEVKPQDVEAISLNDRLLRHLTTDPGTLHITHTIVRLHGSAQSDLPFCELLIKSDQDRQPTRGLHDDVRGHRLIQDPLVTIQEVLRELTTALAGLIVTHGAHHALCVTPKVHVAVHVLEVHHGIMHLLLHQPRESV